MPAVELARLAWRFLAGGRLRGAVIGVALSVVPMVVVQQIADGMIAGIAERFIEAGTYHIQALSRAEEPPEAAPLESQLSHIRQIAGVVSAVPERRGFGLLYSSAGRSGVALRAVPQAWWSEDPLVQGTLSVRAGQFTVEGDDSIVIGVDTARRLELSIGDEVRLLTARSSGADRLLPRISRFRVSGIVTTGYRDLDRLWAFIGYQRGLRVIPRESGTDLIGIKVTDPYALPNPLFRRDLASRLDARPEQRMGTAYATIQEALAPEWTTVNWYQAERGRYGAFLTSRNLLNVVMAMIVLVAVVNISSALVLLVVEKEHDIAVLRATGASSSSIRGTFLFCALWIGLLGSIVGAGVGVLIAARINELLRLIEAALSLVSGRQIQVLNADFYLQTIPVQIRVAPVLLSVGFVLLLSLLASLIPARRAAAIPPDQVLRGGHGRRAG